MQSAGAVRSRTVDPASVLVGAAASLGSGAVIAVIAIPGVRRTTDASMATAVVEGIARGLIVAVPLAVALYARRRPAHARFGNLLAAFSLVWFLALLSSSGSPLLYSAGRVAAWIAEAGLVCVLLAFPTGRLEGRLDRGLIAFVAGVVVVLFLPTALLVHRYPVPTPWASCSTRCPHNAFMAVAHQPGFINQFVAPFREILTSLVFVAVAWRLLARILAASTLMRRTVTPVLAVSSVRMLLFPAALVLRRVAPHSVAAGATMWALALLVPAIGLAFLVGITVWRMFVSAAIQAVHAQLRGIPEPQRVQDVLADAFGDPWLRLGYWARRRRRWVGVSGRSIDPPPRRSGAYLSEVTDGSQPAIAIVHDRALRSERAFIEVSASLAAMAFESERLTARTAGALRELRASRARIAAAEDSHRQRIERELHEGAQQRLVALRVHLEMAADRAEDEDPPEAASLRALGDDVDQALDEIRSVAREIYPTILIDRGLADAVRSVALRSPLPTTVEVGDLSDYPEEVLIAVYLCCDEALQRAADSGRGASEAQIGINENDSVLHFSVSDDGVGSLAGQSQLGDGVTTMRDRLAAIGGDLTVRFRPGEGTRLSGRVPLAGEKKRGRRSELTRGGGRGRTA